MKRYEEYNSSRLPWAPNVPTGWKVVPLKHAYKFQTGATPPTKVNEYFEGDNIWTNISDLNSKVVIDSIKHISDDALKVCSMNISPKDSLMFSFKLSVGTVAFCGCDMYTNEAIATFLKGKNDLNYLYFAGPFFIVKNANENIYGAKLLNQDLINNAKIFLPPLPEQQAIASFLDAKTKPIDDIIAKREQQIALLEEMKSAIISRSVTKGLNPEVKMKDSGIEWIGEVPDGWNLLRFRFLCRIGTGDSDTQDAEPDGEYPFYVRSPQVERSSKFTCEGDAILMAGDGAGAGRVFHHVDGKYAVHQRVYIFNQFNKVVDSNYLYQFMRIMFPQRMNMGSAQSTVPSVRLHMIQNFVVPIPSIDEQRTIASYLDTETAKIDVRIDKRRKQIALLQEYKQALITDAVTGKIDVRGFSS